MRTYWRFGVMALALTALALLTGPAQAGPIIVLDEFGNGTIDGTPLLSEPAGFPFGEVYGFLPTNTVPAIIGLTDPGSPGVVTDLITLNALAPGIMTFSSDLAELGEPSTPGDVLPPLPFGELPPGTLFFTEAGDEFNNGLVYTPAPGAPGFFSTPTGGPTYIFISDGTGPPVPEPTSLALLGLGTAALALWRRRRGQRCSR